MLIKKEDEETDFWPRLLKDKVKEKNGVKIDWDKYVDEDEEEEAFDAQQGAQGMGGGGGGMDPSMMGGMGGPGGPGGGAGGMDMAAMQQMMAGLVKF